jgi:hypothetical protein
MNLLSYITANAPTSLLNSLMRLNVYENYYGNMKIVRWSGNRHVTLIGKAENVKRVTNIERRCVVTDDIVTRLREYDFMRDGDTPDLTMAEAADYIERLQEMVEHLSSQLRLQMKANDKAWEAYKEVVGND